MRRADIYPPIPSDAAGSADMRAKRMVRRHKTFLERRYIMESRVLFITKDKKEGEHKQESLRQIAGAIAQGAKITVDPIEKHTTVHDLNVLFLGCELSFGKIPGEMHKFAKTIESGSVGQVVVFSVSHSPDKTALAEIKAILEPKGVKVNESQLHSPDKVTNKELDDARKFGASIMAAAMNEKW